MSPIVIFCPHPPLYECHQLSYFARHPFAFRMVNGLPLYDLKIFHSSFKLVEDDDEIFGAANSSVEMFDMSGNVNSRLGSPGMEYLITEEQEANKKMKKNVKFNKAFDVAKEAAEFISKYPTEQFTKNLESFKHFTELLRTGLPDDIVDALKRHCEGETREKHPSDKSRPSPPPFVMSGHDLLPDSELCNVEEVSPEHQHYISILGDLVIYKIPGDGSCFFGSCSAHVYEDETQVDHIRRMAHYFLVENWWYFQEFITMPFIETVGVGVGSYNVCYDTIEELHAFFLRDESLKCFSNSQVDLAVMANMFNMNIGVFSHGNNIEPRWSWTSPDPLLTLYSTSVMDNMPDLLLYHYDEVHYDLLLHRDARLAVQGNVPSRLTKILGKKDESNQHCDGPVLREQEQSMEVDFITNNFSPMVFKHCPKGPGRPKKTREGAPAFKKPLAQTQASKRGLENEDNLEQETLPPPKKRGRPKGSKNKPRENTGQPAKKADDLKTRAERSADPDNEETFLDSGDVCEICEFPFNHPLKRTKPKMKCKSCTKTVHIPCYLKNGCTCSW